MNKLILLTLLVGCSSFSKEPEFPSFKGYTKQQIKGIFGTPTTETDLTLKYYHTNKEDRKKLEYCNIDFNFKNNKVTDQSVTGNYCNKLYLDPFRFN